jgi:hypothetical protein
MPKCDPYSYNGVYGQEPLERPKSRQQIEAEEQAKFSRQFDRMCSILGGTGLGRPVDLP